MSLVLRVMTYNVHGCVGTDRRLDVARIARVIEACEADVVALQELDVQRPRSGGFDQPRLLATKLNMTLEFGSSRFCDGGHYGNAVLSRHPLEKVRTSNLPQLQQHWEPRSLQWVKVHAPTGSLNVLNTHLGLDRHERLMQAAMILGRDFIDDACKTGATVLCGDFNALPRSAVYRRLTSTLRDAQLIGPKRRTAAATFPSLFPFMRIDHLLVSAQLEVRSCRVLRSWRARVASDHLPIIADLELGAAT